MRRPAKKNNRGLLAAVGAAVLGVAAGATAVFMSKKENREKVQKTVGVAIKKGKAEVAKAKRRVVATKKKILRK
ncbi:hypothetical protein AUJ42_02215 [Candidatus Collierbacteria bacterium CG1_02_44_10]|uniref:Uncharacterized protein n=4 Tax=Candidatus Collieribacteriota TaxID=1752725 RepID=A0A2H0DTK9_9BACT|nr:hypothetical protein [bacterium]OIN91127.1 MAG: hypothetical protein AUJ42_02215 [Candidatus Collierbacteria bacterium CG1_02_44_10]PIP85492.1 MAG: hypothetical protein COW83_03940 [Candidatus Collierbacteria bacterium CG22_combo_CG10-13_8_21_14_all_43_12]PIR99727.1 MAG: hypothetical protein COT86_02445 [Candidatus Collierbacteria bacterium CG10_big_fil_rev_8_21_14_0_10_43_36]PIZ24685.1 MAG: hypothetical protein COY48_01585 [Candidatus Collierbacteria bacterium CG_4_10_14_0_8_um_filter_43_86